jgi:hypothetical protein
LPPIRATQSTIIGQSRRDGARIICVSIVTVLRFDRTA